MVGLSNVIETAHRLGVRQNLQPYPSLALGAFEVTLLEMTSAYTVFANQGLAFAPYLIERITDSNGDVLEQTHPDPREVESPQSSFQLLQILRGVTQRGTAAAAVARANLKLNIAGKTGTTNDFTDAWFIGMTPRYTVGVWVGNDQKTQSIGKGAEGARVALPIWIRILEQMRDHGRIDPAGGLRGSAEHRLHARRLRDRAEGDGRHARSRARGVRQRLAAHRGVDARARRRSRSCRGRSSSRSTSRRRASCPTKGLGPPPVTPAPPARPSPDRAVAMPTARSRRLRRRRSRGLHVDGQRRDDVAVQADVDGVLSDAADRLGELDAAAVHLDVLRRQRVGDLGRGHGAVELPLFARPSCDGDGRGPRPSARPRRRRPSRGASSRRTSSSPPRGGAGSPSVAS